MIVIAGAGIGGLTLGCALARHGMPFRILERAGDLRPVGAGIALADNAFRALRHIELDGRVRACGQQLRRADICEPSGRVIAGFDVGEIVPGATVAMSRAALQQALRDALGRSVECGRTVEGYEPAGDGVRVRVAGGETIDATLLVGADGLHSSVRRAMRGDETPRYSGQTSWRALVDGVALGDVERFTETWGTRRRFGVVPVGNGSIYWFAVADAPAGGRDGADVRGDLRARFAGWHAPIEHLIAATPADRIVRTDIFDRKPIASWTDGHAVLLGDAAHPMTPNMGMGGCQAIEDAVVLADALAREAGIAAALARYEARRIARANGFVSRSFTMGLVAHARSAPLRWLRNRALAAVPRGLAARAMARDLDFRL